MAHDDLRKISLNLVSDAKAKKPPQKIITRKIEVNVDDALLKEKQQLLDKQGKKVTYRELSQKEVLQMQQATQNQRTEKQKQALSQGLVHAQQLSETSGAQKVMQANAMGNPAQLDKIVLPNFTGASFEQQTLDGMIDFCSMPGEGAARILEPQTLSAFYSVATCLNMDISKMSDMVIMMMMLTLRNMQRKESQSIEQLVRHASLQLDFINTCTQINNQNIERARKFLGAVQSQDTFRKEAKTFENEAKRCALTFMKAAAYQKLNQITGQDKPADTDIEKKLDSKEELKKNADKLKKEVQELEPKVAKDGPLHKEIAQLKADLEKTDKKSPDYQNKKQALKDKESLLKKNQDEIKNKNEEIKKKEKEIGDIDKDLGKIPRIEDKRKEWSSAFEEQIKAAELVKQKEAVLNQIQDKAAKNPQDATLKTQREQAQKELAQAHVDLKNKTKTQDRLAQGLTQDIGNEPFLHLKLKFIKQTEQTQDPKNTAKRDILSEQAADVHGLLAQSMAEKNILVIELARVEADLITHDAKVREIPFTETQQKALYGSKLLVAQATYLSPLAEQSSAARFELEQAQHRLLGKAQELETEKDADKKEDNKRPLDTALKQHKAIYEELRNKQDAVLSALKQYDSQLCSTLEEHGHIQHLRTQPEIEQSWQGLLHTQAPLLEAVLDVSAKQRRLVPVANNPLNYEIETTDAKNSESKAVAHLQKQLGTALDASYRTALISEASRQRYIDRDKHDPEGYKQHLEILKKHQETEKSLALMNLEKSWYQAERNFNTTLIDIKQFSDPVLIDANRKLKDDSPLLTRKKEAEKKLADMRQKLADKKKEREELKKKNPKEFDKLDETSDTQEVEEKVTSKDKDGKDVTQIVKKQKIVRLSLKEQEKQATEARNKAKEDYKEVSQTVILLEDKKKELEKLYGAEKESLEELDLSSKELDDKIALAQIEQEKFKKLLDFSRNIDPQERATPQEQKEIADAYDKYLAAKKKEQPIAKSYDIEQKKLNKQKEALTEKQEKLKRDWPQIEPGENTLSTQDELKKQEIEKQLKTIDTDIKKIDADLKRIKQPLKMAQSASHLAQFDVDQTCYIVSRRAISHRIYKNPIARQAALNTYIESVKKRRVALEALAKIGELDTGVPDNKTFRAHIEGMQSALADSSQETQSDPNQEFETIVSNPGTLTTGAHQQTALPLEKVQQDIRAVSFELKETAQKQKTNAENIQAKEVEYNKKIALLADDTYTLSKIELKEEIEALKNEINQLKKDNTQLAQQKITLDNKLKDLKEKERHLLEKTDTAAVFAPQQQAIENAQKKLSSLQDQHRVIDTELAQAQKEADAYLKSKNQNNLMALLPGDQQATQIQNKINRLTNIQKGIEQEVAAAQVELNLAQTQYQQKLAQPDNASAGTLSLQNARYKTDSQKAQSEAKLHQLEQQKNDLEQSLVSLEKELTTAQQAFAKEDDPTVKSQLASTIRRLKQDKEPILHEQARVNLGIDIEKKALARVTLDVEQTDKNAQEQSFYALWTQLSPVGQQTLGNQPLTYWANIKAAEDFATSTRARFIEVKKDVESTGTISETEEANPPKETDKSPRAELLRYYHAQKQTLLTAQERVSKLKQDFLTQLKSAANQNALITQWQTLTPNEQAQYQGGVNEYAHTFSVQASLYEKTYKNTVQKLTHDYNLFFKESQLTEEQIKEQLKDSTLTVDFPVKWPDYLKKSFEAAQKAQDTFKSKEYNQAADVFMRTEKEMSKLDAAAGAETISAKIETKNKEQAGIDKEIKETEDKVKVLEKQKTEFVQQQNDPKKTDRDLQKLKAQESTCLAKKQNLLSQIDAEKKTGVPNPDKLKSLEQQLTEENKQLSYIDKLIHQNTLKGKNGSQIASLEKQIEQEQNRLNQLQTYKKNLRADIAALEDKKQYLEQSKKRLDVPGEKAMTVEHHYIIDMINQISKALMFGMSPSEAFGGVLQAGISYQEQLYSRLEALSAPAVSRLTQLSSETNQKMRSLFALASKAAKAHAGG